MSGERHSIAEPVFGLSVEGFEFNDFNDDWYVRDFQIGGASQFDPAALAASFSTASAAIDSGDTPPDSWLLNESTNQMDNTPKVTLGKSGSNSSRLIVRCLERKTEVYVDTARLVESGVVRVRFDNSAPSRQVWNKSTDDNALFAPDAVTLARQLARSHTFLLEFTTFEERERTLSFDVSGSLVAS